MASGPADGIRAFIEYAPLAIAIFDTEMRYLAASPKWKRDFGLTTRSVEGRSHYEVFPDLLERWKVIHRQCLTGVDAYADEDLFVRADGTHQWVRWAIQPWRTDTDAVGGLVMFAEDITALKNAQVALARLGTAQTEPTTALMSAATFVPDGSGEASRLALERAHAELGVRATDLEQRTLQLRRLASELTLAEQHARDQLARVLHDDLQQLLFSAKLELERSARRLERGVAVLPTSLEEISRRLDEAIATTRTLAVELSPPMLHDDGGLPAALEWLARWVRDRYGLVVTVTADPLANPLRRDVRTHLFHSVRELLFNVAKHSKVDRASVTLASMADGAIGVTVLDDGVGFDTADVFHPTHPRKSGLGLLTIRERLTLLGGRFEVESAPGHGARFTLVTPPGHVSGREQLDLPMRTSPQGRPHTQGPLRIMIADDHALVRDGLRELLSTWPELQVVGEAANGYEVLAQAHALRPDVIVMDASMPGINGVEATARVREELPQIEILGLSTDERTEELHALERAGASAYFSKGEDAAQLIQRLLALHAGHADPDA